jgi:BMFP domain-containing protein YqiC
MIDPAFIKGLSSKLADVLPAAGQARQKVEAELFQLLQRSLSQLHIVSQEEFQAQVKVLEQAQQRISELEQKIDALERRSQS